MSDSPPRPSTIVEAFWLLHEMRSGDRATRLASNEHWWAWEAVSDAVDKGGDEALALIGELLEWPNADPCLIGAGPLEDLLHTYPAVAPVVAIRCRLSSVWRAAATCVCIDDPSVESALADYLQRRS